VAYRWLADLVMLIHFGFLAFVVLGGFLSWFRPWLIVPHGLAALWGALTVTVGLTCPLTAWEDRARQLAGQQGLPRGFIDTYLTGIVYPEQDLVGAQLLIATLVAVSWAGWAVLRVTRPQPRRTARP